MTVSESLRRSEVAEQRSEAAISKIVDMAVSAVAAIQRIRALHRPVEHRGRTICVECSAWADGSTDNPPTVHPCATIQALGNQEET